MSLKDVLNVLKIVFLISIISFSLDKVLFLFFNKINNNVFTGQAIGKVNHYLKIKDEKEFIVFGSSRASHNVNPDKLSKNGFNIGTDGRNLAFCLPLIKLLDGNKKKQFILIQIDPYHTFQKDYEGDDIQNLRFKYNQNTIIHDAIDQFNQENIFQNVYWSIGYNNKALVLLKNYLKPKYDYTKYNGYDPLVVSNEQREIFKEMLKDYHNPEEDPSYCNQKFILNNTYKVILDELVSFSKNPNKELVFFTAPMYTDTCKVDNNKLAKLLEDKGFDYYDFSDYYNDNNDIIYWKDDIHLSKKGADKFTMYFKGILDNRKNKVLNTQK